MQGFTHLCSPGVQADQVVTRPPAAAETRWAGILPQIAWMNEFSSVLQMYKKDPAKNCVQIEGVETIEKNFLEDYDWVLVSHLDGALRPVGPFIATMEASEKVTSSLVIPMTLAIIHATSPEVPVPCYSYEFGELSEEVIDDDDLSEEVRAVRHKLHKENKERFIVKEREGHYEDNLVCTLLDPRFKLLNFNGSTKAMKKDAEKFLRLNYLADWSPKARPPVPVTHSQGDKGASTSTPAPPLPSPPNILKKKKVQINCYGLF